MALTALITGASRGIGRAIALEFASKGYHIIITCKKSVIELLEVKKEIEEAYHTPCTALTVDMSNYSDVENLFSAIPSIDVLVNNAGIAYFGLLSDMSLEEWQNVINTNLSSCFYACKHAIPLMLQKKTGSIINISSVWGSVGSSMEVAYSASKGGINAFTKALAKELAPSGISVNALACGMIDTQMNASLSPEDVDAIREEIPADRLGTPDEVAQLVWQIATSPSYMTGQIITIDGGWC